MNLDDLAYFLTVAETGLLHRAATQVGISQPALTKAVRRLEAELGVALFERSPKGMQLTAYGSEFRQHAVRLRAAYEDALNQITELHSGELAKVRVGSTPATEPLVSRTFLSLLKKRPALRIELTVQLSDVLVQALLEGQIDLGVAPLPVDLPDDLRAIALLSESTSVVCRKEHPLFQTGKAVTPEDLARCEWILPGPGVSVRKQIEEYFHRHRLAGPRVQVQSNYSSPMGVFFLVANTDMVGICSTQHQPFATQLGLQVLDVNGAKWPRQICCLVRRNGTLSPLATTFVERLADEACSSRLPGRNRRGSKHQ
ncbi:LysR family transcriptional regulator [Paraburkholderia sp.]|uniref:LysR family transcriptional regulator n=1 Tax=Paraburkholderia sp. TaxID=1926495 RepID=UPI0039E4C63C